METLDTAIVGTMLKNNGLTARVYVTGDKTAFIEAFQTNIRTVAAQAGVSDSFSYGYAQLGREYILKIISSGYTVSGTATSFSYDMDDVAIYLIKSGTTNIAYKTTVKGKSANYSITGVAAGTYTMKVMKQNHVTREYTVTVGSSNVMQDVKIHLLGDIDGNGTVTIMDAMRANSHARGVTLLTDYALKCADVVGTDGNVTIMDAMRINAHARGTAKLW